MQGPTPPQPGPHALHNTLRQPPPEWWMGRRGKTRRAFRAMHGDKIPKWVKTNWQYRNHKRMFRGIAGRKL